SCGAVVREVGGADVRMHAEARPSIDAARHLLVDDHAGEEVGAAAAIFGGNIREQEPRFAGLAPDLAADDAFLFPVRMMRRHLALDEAADRRAEEHVVLAKQRLDVHRLFPPPAAPRASRLVGRAMMGSGLARWSHCASFRQVKSGPSLT